MASGKKQLVKIHFMMRLSEHRRQSLRDTIEYLAVMMTEVANDVIPFQDGGAIGYVYRDGRVIVGSTQIASFKLV